MQSLKVLRNIANKVAIAVKLTDKATFAFANEEIKFEILPPGHAATNIIPSAIVGDKNLLKAITKRKVRNGNKTNCENSSDNGRFWM